MKEKAKLSKFFDKALLRNFAFHRFALMKQKHKRRFRQEALTGEKAKWVYLCESACKEVDDYLPFQQKARLFYDSKTASFLFFRTRSGKPVAQFPYFVYLYL